MIATARAAYGAAGAPGSRLCAGWGAEFFITLLGFEAGRAFLAIPRILCQNIINDLL